MMRNVTQLTFSCFDFGQEKEKYEGVKKFSDNHFQTLEFNSQKNDTHI